MYKKPTDAVELEKPISVEDAKQLGMLPLSAPVSYASEYWILKNMEIDCLKAKCNYAYVQEPRGIAIWKATCSFKKP